LAANRELLVDVRTVKRTRDVLLLETLTKSIEIVGLAIDVLFGANLAAATRISFRRVDLTTGRRAPFHLENLLMKMAFLLAAVLACWMVPRTAAADGMAPFSCGGGNRYTRCDRTCPVANGGDCTRRKAGYICGTEGDGTCRQVASLGVCLEQVRGDGGARLSIADGAAMNEDADAAEVNAGSTTDAESSTDADSTSDAHDGSDADVTSDARDGSDVSDASAPELICVVDPVCVEEESGCSVAGDEPDRRRLMGLPGALVLGGVFFLAVDRRRRRRRPQSS
jgi:hypothetical protein